MTNWKMRVNPIENVFNNWQVIVTAKDGTEHIYKHTGDRVAAGELAVKTALTNNIEIKNFKVERA